MELLFITVFVALALIGFVFWKVEQENFKRFNEEFHKVEDLKMKPEDYLFDSFERMEKERDEMHKRKIEFEREIQHINIVRVLRLLRSYKNRGGLDLKSYNKFKANTPLSLSDLKTIEPKEILQYLVAYRNIITEQNKKPKPKWIHV